MSNMTSERAGLVAYLLSKWIRRRASLTNAAQHQWQQRRGDTVAWELVRHWLIFRRVSIEHLCNLALWLNERGI